MRDRLPLTEPRNLPLTTHHPSILTLRPLDEVDDDDDEFSDGGYGGVEGGRETGGGGGDIHKMQIAARRSNAENALLSSIRNEVSQATWAALTKAMGDLRDKTITFDSFSYTTTSILENHLPRCRELHEMVRPGTDIYAYTPPGEDVVFRPYFHKNDLALDWDPKGDNFSTMCTICQGPFNPPIRTLDCKHTFCESCLSRQLLGEEIVYDVHGYVDVKCVTCRQVSIIAATPTTLDEKAHNSLLLAFFEATRRFKCPFDGCDAAIVGPEWDRHLNICMERKFICNKGCGGIVDGFELHWRKEDCIGFLKANREQQEKDIVQLKAQNAELAKKLEMERTRQRAAEQSSTNQRKRSR